MCFVTIASIIFENVNADVDAKYDVAFIFTVFFLRLFAPGVIMSHLPTIRTSKSFVFEDNKTKAVKLKSKKTFSDVLN